MIELDIRYQIQDQLDAKAQSEMQNLTPEEQEDMDNTADTLSPNIPAQEAQ